MANEKTEKPAGGETREERIKRISDEFQSDVERNLRKIPVEPPPKDLKNFKGSRVFAD